MHIVPGQYFRTKKDDFIPTFNYTTTIKGSFLSVNYDIAHIRSTVGQGLVLGTTIIRSQTPSLLLRMKIPTKETQQPKGCK